VRSRRKPGTSRQEQFWFRAQGQRTDGVIWNFSIYTKGTSVSIFCQDGPPGSSREYIWHPLNQGTKTKAMHEIGIVWNVTKVKEVTV
jgi:hypothetical protein